MSEKQALARHLGFEPVRLRTQTLLNNCHETCLAALLDVEPAVIPRMHGQSIGRCPDTLSFLRDAKVGFCYCPFSASVHPKAVSVAGLARTAPVLGLLRVCFLYGYHPTGVQHVVLGNLDESGRVVRVFDPHPSRLGLETVHGMGWLWPRASLNDIGDWPVWVFYNVPSWQEPCNTNNPNYYLNICEENALLEETAHVAKIRSDSRSVCRADHHRRGLRGL